MTTTCPFRIGPDAGKKTFGNAIWNWGTAIYTEKGLTKESGLPFRIAIVRSKVFPDCCRHASEMPSAFSCGKGTKLRFKIVLRHPFELNSVSAFFEHQPAETFSVDDPHYELLTGWSLENEDGSLVVSSGMMPLARRVLLGYLHD